MVAASIRRDERLALGSAELRLVYPQIYRKPLQGPDHARVLLARCELLGAEGAHEFAERVLAEGQARGLLSLNELGELVSVHAPKARARAPRDEHEARERHARQNHLSKRRAAGDTRPDSAILGEYVYRPKPPKAPPPSPVCDAPCDATLQGAVTETPGSVTNHSVTGSVSLKKEEDEKLSSSFSSSPEKPAETLSVTARETPSPPPPCDANAVTHAIVTDPPSPPPPSPMPPMAADLEWSRMQSILGGASRGTIGVAALEVVQTQFRDLLRQLGVTTAELREIAKRAGAGKLTFFRKKVGTPEQKRVDLTLLVSEGAVWNFVSWVNEIRGDANQQSVLGIATNDAAPTAARAPPSKSRTGESPPSTPGVAKSFADMTEAERRALMKDARGKLSSA